MTDEEFIEPGETTSVVPTSRIPVAGNPVTESRVPPEVIGQGADLEVKPPHSGKNGVHLDKSAVHVTPALSDRAAEAHVLSCLLLDPTQATLPEAAFHYPEHRLTYLSIQRLHASGSPVEVGSIAADLSDRGQWQTVGEWPFLFGLENREEIPTTLHLPHYRDRILALMERRQARAHAEATMEALAHGWALPEAPRPIAQPLTGSAPRPITSFAYPEADDPNILLGSDDYLGRGGGFLFVSHAGAGKSSWVMDACMMWSLGRAWMGIKSHAARKVLIIQAEDSDRYIGKIFASFAHVNKLTPEELAQLGANCVIVRLKGVSGAAFFSELGRLTALHNPDLVVINPIYLYAEGDITRSEFAQPFLVGLDHVNRAEKWAYILIHHTGKPQAKGNNGKRAEVEDWESAYMGFGSSYLANWPRATALLEPVAGKPGHYQIKLGKGGFNAGITRQVPQGAGWREEPVTRIAVRHSREKMSVGGRDRPVYYWELDDEPLPEVDRPKKSGRSKAYSVETFIDIIPVESAKAMSQTQLYKFAKADTGISESSFRNVLNEGIELGYFKKIQTSLGWGYYRNPGTY